MIAKPVKEIDYTEMFDRVFSRHIKTRYSVDGIVQCFTCGKWGLIENMECGHYIERARTGTRWDDRNCEVQCWECNRALRGNRDVFAERLKIKHGENIISELKTQAQYHLKKYQIKEQFFQFKEKYL